MQGHPHKTSPLEGVGDECQAPATWPTGKETSTYFARRVCELGSVWMATKYVSPVVRSTDRLARSPSLYWLTAIPAAQLLLQWYTTGKTITTTITTATAATTTIIVTVTTTTNTTATISNTNIVIATTTTTITTIYTYI